MPESSTKQGVASEPAPTVVSHAFPRVTYGIDPYLQIPAVVQHPNAAFLKPYQAKRKGIRVRYIDNLFSKNQPDLIWIPAEEEGKSLLKWQTSVNDEPGLKGIFPGHVLELLDDELYDFGVGTLFVKVRSEEHGVVGYTLLETVLGETDAVGDQLWCSKDLPRRLRTSIVEFQGIPLYSIELPSDSNQIERTIKTFMNPKRYHKTLNAGQSAIHPVFAASAINNILMHALTKEGASKRKPTIIKAAEKFFKYYVIPKATVFPCDCISWPYEFEWKLNWGITLSSPWYSAYTNGVFASAASILYRLTNKEEYRQIALRAANFIGRPMEAGGAEYQISGFRLPAEYIYAAPPLPNVRVLDGELVTLTNLYNAARLLGDSKMLHIVMRQGSSFVMQLDDYRCKDGNLFFAKYIETMPSSYYWQMWSNLQIFANIMKDHRLVETARALEPHVPPID